MTTVLVATLIAVVVALALSELIIALANRDSPRSRLGPGGRPPVYREKRTP